MQNKFEELARTRKQQRLFSRFSVGMVGVALTVLGMAAAFSVFEPTPASAEVVTSGDVRLVSERMVAQPSHSLAYGKYWRRGGGTRAR